MTKYILCDLCFGNYGIQKIAESISNIDGYCPNCKRWSRHLLSKKDAQKIMQIFFVDNASPTSFYPSPFQSRHVGSGMEMHILTDPNVWNDYLLLKEHSHMEIAESGHVKPMRIGGDIFNVQFYEYLNKINVNNIIDINEIPQNLKNIFSQLKEHLSTAVLFPGHSLYRLRIKDQLYNWQDEYWREFDTPPASMKTDNRFNNRKTPMFYASTNVETALLELRPTPDDFVMHRIFLAVLQPAKMIKLLDARPSSYKYIHNNINEYMLDEELFYFLNSLFWVSDNYKITQLFASYIKEILHFDGILYPSALKNLGQHGDNIVIFGYPLAEGKLHLSSINTIIVNDIKYSLSYSALDIID